LQIHYHAAEPRPSADRIYLSALSINTNEMGKVFAVLHDFAEPVIIRPNHRHPMAGFALARKSSAFDAVNTRFKTLLTSEHCID
jgi:hypothetical protein